jgi:hypothetical protein
MMVALAEYRQETAVGSFEDLLDAGVSGGGESGGVEPVAGGEPVVHPLGVRLVLGGHQSGRLGGGQTQRVFELGRCQSPQRPRRRGGGVGTEHRARMPAARKHLRPMQRQSDPWPDLASYDHGEEEQVSGDTAELLAGGQQRRQDQRRTVQRCPRVEVVELESLDERAVQHDRRRWAGRAPPTDHHRVAQALQSQHPARGYP